MKTLEFSIQSTSSASSDSVYLFISNMLYFFLSAAVKMSNSTLNRSGESEHPCLIPEFSKEGFIFSPMNIMLAMDLS